MAKKINENYNEEMKAALEKLTWSGHVVANHNIVEREEAHDYITTHGLKVMYQQELDDGTPRRIWLLMDTEGRTQGRLYTARGHEGYKNKEKFQEDIFDFMEIRVPRGTYVKGENNIAG